MRNNSEADIQRAAKLEQTQIKNDERIFTLLCKALGDDVSFAIIKSTMKQGKSVFEISKARQLPSSSVYKKIKKLHDLGIVRVDRIDIDERNGKKITYYKSRIRSLELNITGEGDTSLRIETLVSHMEYDSYKSRGDLFSATNTRQ